MYVSIGVFYKRLNLFFRIQLRQTEDKNPKLEISVHDVFRNENAKIRRDYLRKQAEIEAKRQQETEMDYLAPFLALMGDPKPLTRPQGMEIILQTLLPCTMGIVYCSKNVRQ